MLTVLNFITPFLQKGVNLFNKNKYNVIVTLLFLLTLISSYYVIKHKNNVITNQQVALNISEQNFKTSLDSIRETYTKDKQLEYNKYVYVVEKQKDLEKINKALYEELKVTKGKIDLIIKTGVKIKNDTVYLTSETKEDPDKNGFIKIDFKLDTVFSPGNYRKLKGFSVYDQLIKKGSTLLTEDEQGIRLITGLKNVKEGKPEIFIRSDHPNLSIVDIEGAIIDPTLFKSKEDKTPLITVGLGVGWIPIAYNLRTKQVNFDMERIGISAGLNINILKLLRNGKKIQ